MKNATILVLASKDCQTSTLEPLIELARADDLHLAVVVMNLTPQLPVYSYGFSPYSPPVFPDAWQEEFLSNAEAISKKVQEIEALFENEAILGNVTAINCETSLMADAVAERAMVSDLCVVTPDLRAAADIFTPAIHSVLFRSPIAVLINGAQNDAAVKPERVFVAWKDGLPSARAVRQALPMLARAQEVTIAIFDPVMTEQRDGENPGSDVAEWLSHHGCKVDVKQYPSGGKEIGDCIIERATEIGADLVVMGAYGHSKFREGILGGTTRTLIEQKELPVLLAH